MGPSKLDWATVPSNNYVSQQSFDFCNSCKLHVLDEYKTIRATNLPELYPKILLPPRFAAKIHQLVLLKIIGVKFENSAKQRSIVCG